LIAFSIELGVEMIRTFWFAAFCLAGLGGVLATRVTASVAITGESVLDPALLSVGLAPDTLSKADRLDVAYYLPSAAPTPAEIFPELPAARVAVLPAKPGARAKASSQPAAAANIDRKSVMLPRPRPKIRLAKNTHPPKPIVESKTCAQPEGLGGLLMAFAGTPRCG
jgi:hypothetical protein